MDPNATAQFIAETAFVFAPYIAGAIIVVAVGLLILTSFLNFVYERLLK